MSISLGQKLQQYRQKCITQHDLAALLYGGTTDSCGGKIHRAVDKGQLIRIKRGLYCLGTYFTTTQPNPFAVSQFIYGPSYISLASALAYHGLIPEAVYSTTAVTIKRSNEFVTPLGRFSYSRLPTKNFFTLVKLERDNKTTAFFISTPWRALLDYIFCYKKSYNLSEMAEDLRLDLADLPKIGNNDLQQLQKFYSSNRINKFIKAIPGEFINEHCHN